MQKTLMIQQFLEYSYDYDVNLFWDTDIVKENLKENLNNLDDDVRKEEIQKLINFIDDNYYKLNQLLSLLYSF